MNTDGPCHRLSDITLPREGYVIVVVVVAGWLQLSCSVSLHMDVTQPYGGIARDTQFRLPINHTLRVSVYKVAFYPSPV